MLHQEIPFISQMNSLVPDRFLRRSANWRPDQRCPRRNGNESLWSVVVSKVKFVKDTRCTSPRKENQVSGLGIGSFRNEAVRDSDQSVFWGSRTRYCCSKKNLTQFTQYHVICIYFWKHINSILCSSIVQQSQLVGGLRRSLTSSGAGGPEEGHRTKLGGWTRVEVWRRVAGSAPR